MIGVKFEPNGLKLTKLWPGKVAKMATFQWALPSCSGHLRIKILAASCFSHFFGQDKRTTGACHSISNTGEAFKVMKCHVTAARVSARIARTDARSVT